MNELSFRTSDFKYCVESPIPDRRFCTYSIKHIYHTISTDILDKIVWKVSSTEITRLEIEVLYIHLTNEIDQHSFLRIINFITQYKDMAKGLSFSLIVQHI